jgi:hypothetical protein
MQAPGSGAGRGAGQMTQRRFENTATMPATTSDNGRTVNIMSRAATKPAERHQGEKPVCTAAMTACAGVAMTAGNKRDE